MKLSKRLNTIISLIDKDTTVIDVGCDHALIDIYLTLNNRNKCIACDINKNVIELANKNIKKYNLEDQIELVLTDGLDKIDIPKNNTILICGMGTSTILGILNDVNKIDNLIIQSNNNHYLLRKKIIRLGFYIDKEIIVKDKNIYYDIIKFKKGYKKYKYFEYLYGINLNDREYIEYLINKNNAVYNALPNKKIIEKIKLRVSNIYLKKL